MRQNFKDINIFSGFGRQNGQDWQKENGITANWKTPEQIDIQPVYTQEDLAGSFIYSSGYGKKEADHSYHVSSRNRSGTENCR